ncbi:MAG: XRE family transcriptional regulator [Comamonadaceae bacterium]|nr:MAG: XRE family transcriptional regulator [Comamonadaceae bacterium]
MQTMQHMAEILETERQRRELDYQQLAERCGLTPLSVRHVLQGRSAPRITTLMAIASELGLEVLLLPKIVAQGLEAHSAVEDNPAPALSQVDRIVAQTLQRSTPSRKKGEWP